LNSYKHEYLIKRHRLSLLNVNALSISISEKTDIIIPQCIFTLSQRQLVINHLCLFLMHNRSLGSRPGENVINNGCRRAPYILQPIFLPINLTREIKKSSPTAYIHHGHLLIFAPLHQSFITGQWHAACSYTKQTKNK